MAQDARLDGGDGTPAVDRATGPRVRARAARRRDGPRRGARGRLPPASAARPARQPGGADGLGRCHRRRPVGRRSPADRGQDDPVARRPAPALAAARIDGRADRDRPWRLPARRRRLRRGRRALRAARRRRSRGAGARRPRRGGARCSARRSTLWRGPAYAEFADAEFAVAEARAPRRAAPPGDRGPRRGAAGGRDGGGGDPGAGTPRRRGAGPRTGVGAPDAGAVRRRPPAPRPRRLPAGAAQRWRSRSDSNPAPNCAPSSGRSSTRIPS